MDKMTFASYKFKPSDVIEGLNRYFAKTKANRYLRVPLEIRNGEVKPGNYYVFRNIVFRTFTPKIKELGYYYLVCDPEEVVGVAINWLREEHDIFYTPGMEVPIEDFDVDEAAKKYEKETRKDRISDILCTIEELQKNLHEAKRRAVALEAGHAEKSKIIDRQAARIKDLEEQLREANEELADHREVEGWLRKDNSDLVKDRNQFGKRLADIRHASGMAVGDPSDLVEYVKALREKTEENSVLRGNLDYFANLAQVRQKTLANVRDEILKVYREIFDCSNGDPEGSYEETLQDILTEYKRVLELKDAAEDKAIKYKELARENEEKARRYVDVAKENRLQWNNTRDQLQWAQKENLEWVKRYEKLKSELNEMKQSYGESVITSGGLCEDLTKEREKVKRMEQKLIEIQDICER